MEPQATRGKYLPGGGPPPEPEFGARRISSEMFLGYRAFVRQILECYGAFPWSVQGFGMLRCYIGGRDIRLHVWSDTIRVPDVTDIHDHPWDFTSYVLSGCIVNRRYSIDETPCMAPTDNMTTIQCGQDACVAGPVQPVHLRQVAVERVVKGYSYCQLADEIHRSEPEPGTVSLIARRFRADTEHARVFFPLGTEWVSSASPVSADLTIVRDVVKLALERWDA